MSKHASPTKIGAFVIGVLALLIASVLIIGGGRFFHDTALVVVYFDGSVSGLRVGAPVKFRGIEIGTVKDIRINMTGAIRNPQEIRIPVLLELDEERLTSQGIDGVDFSDPQEVARLVALGLRAGLATESFVTGIRYVALDIVPSAPAPLVHDSRYPEVPSVASVYDAIPQRMSDVLTRLAEVDLQGIARSLRTTIEHTDRLIVRLDRMLASRDLARAVASLDEIASSLHPAIDEIRDTAATTRRVPTQMEATLREVQIAARSMRRLTDQLGRDPGAIVRGGRP